MADEQPTVVFTSFDPADAVRGGLISDVDVQIKELVWTLEAPPDYHSREPNYFLKGYLALIEDLNVVEEVWWSAGGKKGHTPCDDAGTPAKEGYRLTGGPMIQGSNAYFFMDSLKKCGIDAAPGSHRMASGTLKQLLDVEMHVIRKVIQREGLQNAPKEDGRTAPGVVLCQKIIRVPGEKRVERAGRAKPAAAAHAAAAAAPAAARKPDKAPAAPASPNPIHPALDAEELAGIVLADLMGGATDGLLVSDVKVQANRTLFSAHKLSLADRAKVIETMLDPVWLETQGVLLEGETLVLAP
jgi:hypothetical protein